MPGQLAVQPSDKTLKQLFLDDFWEVPEFQREYVWRANREVRRLIEDLVQAFREDLPDYFLGSVVYYKESDGTRALVDGQQRLTTLLLLIASLRDLMQEPLPAMHKAIRDIDAAGESDEPRFRIALQYSEVTNVLEKLCSGKRADLEPGRGGPRYYLVHAYDQCLRQLSDEFGEDTDSDLKNFWKYLWMSAHVVTIETPDLKSAYKIFETLNDRGKALNASDLLRNYLFRSSGSGKSTQKALQAEWNVLTDALRAAGESTQVRFLRYYLMATYGLAPGEALDEGSRSRAEIIRADGLFDWIVRNDSLLKASSKPETFAKSLSEAAVAYGNFLTGKDRNGKPLAPLENIVYQRTGVRQHLCLLLAGRHLLPKPFEQLASAIETLTLCFAIAGVPWNTLEKRLPEWSSRIRNLESLEDVKDFVDKEMRPEIQSHGMKLWEQMDRIYSVSPSLAKYVLARLTAYAQSAAVAGGTMNQLMDSKVSVEHILPRSLKDPVKAKQENWVDFGASSREEAAPYVERLGNLCLVGWGANSQLSDHTYGMAPKDAKPKYEVKRDLLVDVPWLLTYGIAGKTAPSKKKPGPKPTTGKDIFIDRYGMAPPAAVWNASEVIRRQAYLKAMIADLWPLLPEPADTNEGEVKSVISAPHHSMPTEEDTLELIGKGESDSLEFKASFKWSYKEDRFVKDLVEATLQATIAFMNSYGGVLLVGVDDDGTIVGLEQDLKSVGSRDKLEVFYRNSLTSAVGTKAASIPKIAFLDLDGHTLCRIDVARSPQPVFGKAGELRIRSGGSSRVLDPKDTHDYIQDHW